MEHSKVAFPKDRHELIIWKIQDPWATAVGVLIFPPRPKRQGQHLLVLKGSEFQIGTADSCPPNAKKMRKYIEREKMLDEFENYRRVLNCDIIFGYPSTAANVILGISRDGWGWKGWKHEFRSEFGCREYSLHNFIEREKDNSSPVPLTMSYYEAPAEAFDTTRINWKEES